MAPLMRIVARRMRDNSAAAIVSLRKAPILPSEGVALMMKAGTIMDRTGEDTRRGGLL